MTTPTGTPGGDMSVADFNELRDAARKDLDELIAFAVALDEPSEMDTAFTLTGKVVRTDWKTSVPLILTAAVARLAAAREVQ